MVEENKSYFESLYLEKEQIGKSIKIPHYDGKHYLINGKLIEWKGRFSPVYSPVYEKGTDKRIVLGQYPMLTDKEAVEAVQAAEKAFDNGRGLWPCMTVKDRIFHVTKFLARLKEIKDTIVELLMWEICKTKADAQKEVDRTIKYVYDTISELKSLENRQSTFINDTGIVTQIRRAPLGTVLCLGPFNYPFNETYTTLIPALIMGNTVVMKLPRVGVLCHMPTLQIFQEIFPPGVINIVSGSGRETMPAIMKTGKIDVFAFIGTSKAADDLQKSHPKPHRLRICLGLEAKNPAIIMEDADLSVAVSECVSGTLSYNGQRCTALKILFVHQSISDKFVEEFVNAVDNLKMGLPWEEGTKITPLPEEGKPGYLKELIDDALAKGAKIINKRGGNIDRTFVAPTILYPVSENMRIYHEEQFGPVIPIRSFGKMEEIFHYLATSPYGQQASIFGKDFEKISDLIDVLVNQVSRVNLNAQCQRGPDTLPFTGRKDSSYGTLSVGDALRVFSIRALVATKEDATNEEILSQIVAKRRSHFLRTDFLF
ncbi:MAG: NADP-dependent glyceraldehyde-3-phosphate dehydrogenase [Candidatus Thorarchaeota archaeon]